MHDELDELADLPPEEFVSARNQLAKRLKREGSVELAAEVGKRRKPTLSQWIAGQVRRHEAGVVDALRMASRDVASAQEAVITGGDRDALRAATEQRREALRAVGRAVEQILARNGRPAQHRDEVLRAIEADVTAEVASGSFGMRHDLELPDRPKKEQARPPDAAAERRAAERRAAIEAAEARVRRARQELETAEAALEAVQIRHDEEPLGQ